MVVIQASFNTCQIECIYHNWIRIIGTRLFWGRVWIQRVLIFWIGGLHPQEVKEALPLSKCFTLQPSNSLLGTVTDTQASPCNKLSVIFSLCIRIVLPSLLFSVNKRFILPIWSGLVELETRFGAVIFLRLHEICENSKVATGTTLSSFQGQGKVWMPHLWL